MNERTERWREFASQDLQMAELALTGALYNQVCFHCQQCLEKLLKALLADQETATPRTHSIVDLLALFPADFLNDLRDELGDMDLYYLPTRYPDALPGSLAEGLPDREDAEEALLLTRAVMQRCTAETI
ncbi:MAG: hypothetical protein A2284_04885 [Deltaproteobacteria bacterium RIFOXYA12_FULL_61_11]|nr:MAG: hypothetical protein A2284_04885 [Deltaproteobacteria bacterium RIFOXYA12_FULL_61_11]